MLASLILALAVQCPPGVTCPAPAGVSASARYEGAGDMQRPGPAADPAKAINGLRATFGVKPLARDARLDNAAAISVADLAATGQVHRVMLDAARQAGIPDGPRPAGSVFLNYTEGAQLRPGYLGDFLRAMAYFAATAPDEGHLVDFRNPNWTHFGFAEAPGGSPCVIWYGYFPGDVRPESPPVPANPRAAAPVAAPRNPGPARAAREADPDDEAIDAVLSPAVGVSTPTGAGSGVIVSSRKDGGSYLNTVFTVAHVVAGGGEPVIQLTPYEDGLHAGDARTYRAIVVRMDRRTDAAVLSFRSLLPKPAAAIDWSPRLRLGHRLAKVGHGIGLAARLDFGHLSHGSSPTNVSSVRAFRMAIPTYPGDSGGPVFRGAQLVALTDSGQIHADFGQMSSAQMIGYAIPIRDAFRKSDLQ